MVQTPPHEGPASATLLMLMWMEKIGHEPIMSTGGGWQEQSIAILLSL